MVITIILLVIVCIVLIFKLSKKTQLDKEIEQENQRLHQYNEFTKKECQDLQCQISSLSYEYQSLNQQKENAFNELNRLNINLSELKSQNENVANEALQNYIEILEQQYEKAENNYDNQITELHNTLHTMHQELDKLKATRAAAHEALLKEQEVKDNKDNYKLSPSQADLADARRLEIVKRELNKPRILSMLIWQTYWQPLAKKQFPLILKDKTKCGIYKITNQMTDECYIGQAVDVYKRWNEHCKCGLGIDTPPGNKLYKAMQDYGLENFTFELLTECNQSELNEKEKYFIELYQADTFGYNGNRGVTK
ncbi:MAG: GIY-YIG nuclease family protein [Methanobrevibacter sp.]|nr:GIY-YIG nuclease family protein [Methanobrevibacter sp.]